MTSNTTLEKLSAEQLKGWILDLHHAGAYRVVVGPVQVEFATVEPVPPLDVSDETDDELEDQRKKRLEKLLFHSA